MAFASKIQPAAAREDKSRATYGTDTYLPCIQPIGYLEPISIQDMQPGAHHSGRKVMLRVLSCTHVKTEADATAEDSNGTRAFLQLFPCPSKATGSAQAGPVGICVVKERSASPRRNPTHGCTLRVDHVSDIVWQADDDERILPAEWRNHQTSASPGSLSIRLLGNEAVQRKEWDEAVRL